MGLRAIVRPPGESYARALSAQEPRPGIDVALARRQHAEYRAALQAAGNSADIIIKKGGDHSWPTIKEEIEKLAEWFDTKLPNGK